VGEKLGSALIFRRLWEELGLAAALRGMVENSSAQTDFEEAVFAMTLGRLLDPASKLGTSQWMRTIHRPQWEELDPHHLYRTLDFLMDRKPEIEPALYARVRDLFNLKLDLVLWDTTCRGAPVHRGSEDAAAQGGGGGPGPGRPRPAGPERSPGQAAGEAGRRRGQTADRQGAYRRYLKVSRTGLEIDETSAEDEARLDGKYVLRTNSSLDSEEVATAYKSLWQVERAFRELKSGLDLRPVYHWTEKRIRGHVMVCFFVLVLEMVLRRKIAALGEDLPYDELLSDLSQLKAVDIRLDGTRYLARTQLVGHAELAFRAVGMRPPLHITKMPPAPANPKRECSGT